MYPSSFLVITSNGGIQPGSIEPFHESRQRGVVVRIVVFTWL